MIYLFILIFICFANRPTLLNLSYQVGPKWFVGFIKSYWFMNYKKKSTQIEI